MKNINYQVLFSYLLGLIFLYPVVAHVLMYQLGFLTDRLPHGRLWVYTQIFLSGPVLITIGLLLYLKNGHSLVNKIFGIMFFLIGLYWLYTIVSDIIKEAA